MVRSQANPVLEIKVTAYMGASYGSFPIDLATDLHMISAPERVRPTPVVDVPGMTQLPEITVYPLSDQVADKVCAMYEKHGGDGRHSTRYRDLVDLVLIVTTCELDAARTVAGLVSEQRRRNLELPMAMTDPGPGWNAGYAATARKTRLPTKLHQFSEALAVVAACLDPILAGRDGGTWNPDTGWSS